MANSSDTKLHGFYLELDHLFDTRYAVLEEIDEIKADELLMKGYHARQRDEFPGFDTALFRERYKNRDKYLLAKSKPTGILINLLKILQLYMVSNSIEGINPQINIILNIYPYKLDEHEMDEFVLCLKHLTNNICPVRIINANPLDITPEWLEANVVAFFQYNWNQWLGKHTAALMKRRLDNVIMVAPRLVELTEEEGKEQIRKLEEEYKDEVDLNETMTIDKGKDPYSVIEDWCRLFIGLQFYETRDFSLYLPDEIELPPDRFETDKSVFNYFHYSDDSSEDYSSSSPSSSSGTP